MPFPKGATGKGRGGEAPPNDACGLCGSTVDKNEPWIEGTCSSCGTRPFCFECVADFMEKEVRTMDSKGNRKNDKNLVYARQYPQNIFARNCHIMSRKPVCPGTLGAKDCPGLMDSAELIRPHKPAEEAAPPPAPVPAPAKKHRQQQHLAGAEAVPMPKPAKQAGTASPALAAPARSASAGSVASGASASTKLPPAPSRPGGGAAAALGPSKLDGQRGAPTFAQLQLMEQKARKKEQRAAAAAAARSAVSRTDSSSSGARPALPETPTQQRPQQPRSLSNGSTTWDVLATADGEFGEHLGTAWGTEFDDYGNSGSAGDFPGAHPATAASGSAAATATDAFSLPAWSEAGAERHGMDDDAAYRAAVAASLADAGGASMAAGQGAAHSHGSFGWPQQQAVAAPVAASHDYWPGQGASAVPAGAPADSNDELDPAGLAALLRQQQEQLMRQWQQKGGDHLEIWQQPAPAPAFPEPAPLPEPEPQAVLLPLPAVWEHELKRPAYAEGGVMVQGGLGLESGDAEVDELLALMGIS